jgi:hypothetical protein
MPVNDDLHPAALHDALSSPLVSPGKNKTDGNDVSVALAALTFTMPTAASANAITQSVLSRFT